MRVERDSSRFIGKHRGHFGVDPVLAHAHEHGNRPKQDRAPAAERGLSDYSRCWIRATLRLYLENRAVVSPTVVIDPKQITGVVAAQLAIRLDPFSKSVEGVQHRCGPCRVRRCWWTKHERQSVSVGS